MTKNIFYLNWPEKILFIALTAVLFVAGFFAGLLALAVAGALMILAASKLWWRKRQRDARTLDAEYHVLYD